MIVCPHCGWENPSEAAFCTNCGRGLARARAGKPATLDPSGGETRPDRGRRPKAADAAGRTVSNPESPPKPSRDRSADPPPGAASLPPLMPSASAAAREPTPMPRLRAPPPAQDATATLVDFRMRSNALAEVAATYPPSPEVKPGETGLDDTVSPPETPVLPPVATPVAEILPLAWLSGDSPQHVARTLEPDDADDPVPAPLEVAPAASLRPETPNGLIALAEPGGESDAELEIEDISVSELELTAGEAQFLRSGELQAILLEPTRQAPPPLREMDVRFILRPLSNNLTESRLITVGERGLSIGRVDADVVLAEDAFISPRHLLLTVEHDMLFAEDQGSLNGSWLRVRTQVELRPGNSFRIGHQLLRFDYLSGRPGLGEMPDRTRRFGAPRANPALCLQQMGDDNQPRNVYCLNEQGARLGRHLADIVFTDDTFMSGTHAVVLPRGDRAVLRDLSSRNGTWVRIEGRHALTLGDAIMLGQAVWRVSRPVT